MTYTERLIARAIRIWKCGRPIPLTLATALLAQGVDVSGLEQMYYN